MDEPILPQHVLQRPAEIDSVDWLFEPLWRGDRLIARVRDGRVSLSDELGRDATDEFDEVAGALAPSVAAADAVLDGVWSVQPFVGEGSAARQWASTIEEEGFADDLPDPVASERRRAFVVLDIIELDGQPLGEVPYQERRRLMAAVVIEGVQVRINPAVRLPIGSWLMAWQSNGFTDYVAKHSNSRYLPGEVNDDWIQIPIRPGRPGMSRRLLGLQRERKIRIRD